MALPVSILGNVTELTDILGVTVGSAGTGRIHAGQIHSNRLTHVITGLNSEHSKYVNEF